MKIFPKQQKLFWFMILCFLTVTVRHKSCEILFLNIFHKSTFQTPLQLSRFSIWKVNPSLKESSLEFWCNVTLNNCMSLNTNYSTCISYCNWSTGIGMKWNTSTDLSIFEIRFILYLSLSTLNRRRGKYFMLLTTASTLVGAQDHFICVNQENDFTVKVEM